MLSFSLKLQEASSFWTQLYAGSLFWGKSGWLWGRLCYVDYVESPDFGRLTMELMLWASLQPEVPLYIWRGDFLWAQLPKRMEEADAYAQKLEACTAQTEAQAAEVEAFKQLLASQKATLLYMQQGQLAKAEAEQMRACHLEAQLSEMLSLFSWPKVEYRPVYDRATQVSRYDVVEERRGTVQVFCAFRGCKKPQTLEFSRTNSWYTPSCVACGRSFFVMVARLLELRAEKEKGHTRYRLRLEDAGHRNIRVEFTDGSGDTWQVVERDYLALLYAWNAQDTTRRKEAELSAVVNLTRGRIFWLSKVGNCFIATAFLGAGARELPLFWRFRDEVLLKSLWGRLAVRAYYATGPFAVRLLQTQPWLKAPIRRWLRHIHRRLQRKFNQSLES